MSKFQVVNRDRSWVVQNKEHLSAAVEWMSWQAQGGPDEAVYLAEGSPEDINLVFERLRYGVEIYDERGRKVWWGYVHQVELIGEDGNPGLMASLDGVINRAAVRYRELIPEALEYGRVKDTDWGEDSSAAGVYGKREQLLSLDHATSAQALAYRDAVLWNQAYPRVVTQGGFGACPYLRARVRCRGWWHSLDWQYAPMPRLDPVIGYFDITGTTQAVGSGSYNSRVFELITLPQCMNALRVGVYASKVGTPTDGLLMSLYSATSDGPDVFLGSATIGASALSTSLQWVVATLSSEVRLPLEAARTMAICLVVERTGAINSTNYYKVCINEGSTFQDRYFRIWSGSAWGPRVPAADMLCRIEPNNLVETTQQMVDLARSGGQFLTAVNLQAASGISSVSIRGGEVRTKAALLELLEAGGTTGRRYLAQVDESINLVIREAPSAKEIGAEGPYLLYGSGEIRNPADREIEPYWCPAGVWAVLKDGLAGPVDLGSVQGGLVFIERVKYLAGSERVEIEPSTWGRLPRGFGEWKG